MHTVYFPFLYAFSALPSARTARDVDDSYYDYDYNPSEYNSSSYSYAYDDEEDGEPLWPSEKEEEEEVEMLSANPQFVTEAMDMKVELGHTIRLPCQVDKLGEKCFN